MNERRAEAGAWAVVCALFVAAAGARLVALASSPFPTGVDGYWYLLQARSLLEHARLYSPSAPLVPWLVAAATPMLGPVLALKVVAAVGSAALVLPCYAVAKRLAGARGPALLGAALVATSAQSSFLCTEFVKQALGLTLVMGFLAALASWLERPGAARAAWAGALLVLCALAHKTALGLAVLLAAGPVLARLRHRRLARAGALLAALAVLVVLALAGQGPSALDHLVRGTPDFSLAVLATPGRPALVLGHEVAWAAGLAVAALLLAAFRQPTAGPRLSALAIGFIVFAIVQGLPWIDIVDDQGLGYRLRLCACLCLGPCAALLAARLLAGARPAPRASLLGLAIGLVVVARPWSTQEGVVKAHPAMVEATARLAGALPSDATVVIPERHTAFMAAWYGRVAVRLQPPPVVEPARIFRLLPGAAIRPALWAALDELRAHPVPGVAPSRDLHSLHPNGLVLLSEPTFQHLLATLPAADRDWYQDWHVR